MIDCNRLSAIALPTRQAKDVVCEGATGHEDCKGFENRRPTSADTNDTIHLHIYARCVVGSIAQQIHIRATDLLHLR